MVKTGGGVSCSCRDLLVAGMNAGVGSGSGAADAAVGVGGRVGGFEHGAGLAGETRSRLGLQLPSSAAAKSRERGLVLFLFLVAIAEWASERAKFRGSSGWG